MHGDNTDPKKPIPGLINQLSNCVGMLARLVRLVPASQFRTLVNGIFVSKILYCLELYGVVRGTETLRDCDSRYNSFTKSHLQALQTLLNKIMRLITGQGYDTPVLQLLRDTNMLSINQLISFTTIMTTFKVKMSGKPKYLAKRLGFSEDSGRRSHRNQENISINFKLATARQGFMYRAGKGWSSLPAHLKLETREPAFKKGLREWVFSHVPALPQNQQ